MKILIGCAKDMSQTSNARPRLVSEPMFKEQATANALQMTRYDAEEIADMLGCNTQIANDNLLRYRHFADPDKGLQSLFAYTGIVFKYIAPESFTTYDFAYAQKHLLITSFLYGLLRPMDEIKCYRMEGNVELPDNDKTMFDYWKPFLTDTLIDAVNSDGGTLVDIASKEMRRLFDWRKVEKKIRVIRPEFYVSRGGRLRTIVIYSKMCRGAMARYLIKERISAPSKLRDFSFEGFTYNTSDSTPDRPIYVQEQP